jgi:hypothetical protein
VGVELRAVSTMVGYEVVAGSQTADVNRAAEATQIHGFQRGPALCAKLVVRQKSHNDKTT